MLNSKLMRCKKCGGVMDVITQQEVTPWYEWAFVGKELHIVMKMNYQPYTRQGWKDKKAIKHAGRPVFENEVMRGASTSCAGRAFCRDCSNVLSLKKPSA